MSTATLILKSMHPRPEVRIVSARMFGNQIVAYLNRPLPVHVDYHENTRICNHVITKALRSRVRTVIRDRVRYKGCKLLVKVKAVFIRVGKVKHLDHNMEDKGENILFIHLEVKGDKAVTIPRSMRELYLNKALKRVIYKPHILN